MKFAIDTFIEKIEGCYHQWDAPVIDLIANRGASPFQILVSTLLSLRTKDAVTNAASQRLFEVARTPQEIVALDRETIQKRIYPVGFYQTKAKRLMEISNIIIKNYDGRVPDTLNELLTLPGVGRKTANLVLSAGFNRDAICVDTHVHRISNRIGYVHTKKTDNTEFELRKKLPRKYWQSYNTLLVAFGQMICRPISPLCSRCPVNRMCPKIGVTRFR